MSHTISWRNFRRTQTCAPIAAGLIYGGALLYAWGALPGAQGLKLGVLVAFPLGYLLATLAACVYVRPIRRKLARYVWLSFVAGFGQKPASILIGVGVLAAAGALIYHQVHDAAGGGRYPAGVFSAYGAGIGILIAQAVLTRALERDRAIAPLIEEP